MRWYIIEFELTHIGLFAMRVRQSAGTAKRKRYKKKAPSPRGQILQRKFFINLNFMNKIYSCVSKDSVINLCSLNGFLVTRRG
jgi:hypothetical protein